MRSVIPDVSFEGGWLANHRVAPMQSESAPMAGGKTRTYVREWPERASKKVGTALRAVRMIGENLDANTEHPDKTRRCVPSCS